MPTKNATFAKQPTYRLRPDYGQAIVTLTDAVTRKRRDYWLGEYNSPESHEMYRRVLACWEGSGRRLFDPNDVPKATTNSTTITELIYRYKQHVDVTYKRPSRQTIYMALRILRQYFGSTAAVEFRLVHLSRVEVRIRLIQHSDDPKGMDTAEEALPDFTAWIGKLWAGRNETYRAGRTVILWTKDPGR